MNEVSLHRLEGLEPDNLLAFLALLGLLRAISNADDELHARVFWETNSAPLRPTLMLAQNLAPEQVAEVAAKGVAALAARHNFGARADLNYSRSECRTLLEKEARTTTSISRDRADLLAALMSDAAIKDDKREPVDPTQLCLMFGQGHQHFLQRLAKVPSEPAPPPRGKGKNLQKVTAAGCLFETLFRPWQRVDPTFSFRWDPEEDVRYSLLAGDPTDAKYKLGTQHGANRLASIGLAAVTLVPETRGGRIRPRIIGGYHDKRGFSFAWPIWTEPATISAIRAMLAHPGLRLVDGLKHLSVEYVLVAQRISVGKFMNFGRARPLGS